MTGKEMVEKFLCPGCVAGSDTNCGQYLPTRGTDPFDGCRNHCLGTRLMPGVGLVALGMPKGFNRPGVYHDKWDKPLQPHHMSIALIPKDTECNLLNFDWLNVPVWALEHEGFLFIRVMQPRVGMTGVIVVEGGKAKKICPRAIDVTDKYKDYD